MKEGRKEKNRSLLEGVLMIIAGEEEPPFLPPRYTLYPPSALSFGVTSSLVVYEGRVWGGQWTFLCH